MGFMKTLKNLNLGESLFSIIENLRETMFFFKDCRMVFDVCNVIIKTDQNGLVLYVNKKFKELTGFSDKEIREKPLTVFYSEFTDEKILKELSFFMKEGKLWKGKLIGKKKNGGKYIIDTTIVPLLKSKKNLFIGHDITELEENKQELQYLFNHDVLTGLPNRNKLLEDIKNLKKPALCVFDISDFRSLNELLGEKCGDSILKEISKELKRFESKVHPYRIYSDEFALLYDLENGRINFKEFLSYCIEIVNFLEDKTFRCKGLDVYLNFTIGITTGKWENKNEKALIYADIALTKAKKEKKKIVVLKYEREDKKNYIENMLWIRKIKKAFEEDRIVPFYQPIVNNEIGTVEKFEALVRLLGKNKSTISPEKFLPVVKKAKLYPRITKTIIEKVFNDFKNMPFEVSLNLSFEDLISEKTIEFILNKVKSFSDPSRITFEILETEEIENYNLLYKFISQIKELGCKFAIDDFGTGYSNLEHLMKLKVDYLKIDGSIIRRIPEDKGARILTEAVVSFSKELGIKTIAEFVSDQKLYEMVKSLGVNYSQGYYLGKPEPIEVIREKFTSS
ncbi:EAL domain-containing protein [Desulfurobacterium thermolithotrophum]|uniref:bifunctional diguanylate cyclase/phosphodiesterase n=1 Tax=Desulfurobacterium thermolithotrophum TaxID=64160 RepID=UPI0019540E36|nr:GGDEF domain-containing phosphodiesterase [Desulfurobacterium thermolithotrophum]